MITALITGALYGAPQEKTAKSGCGYTVATLKVRDKDDAVSWVRLTGFSESTQAELLRLGDGDSLSVQGPFKAELYERDDGEKRISLSIVVDQVLALRQPPKERSPDLLTRDYRSKEQRQRGFMARAGRWAIRQHRPLQFEGAGDAGPYTNCARPWGRSQ